ncbi:lipoprotein [Fuerstiella marisgermanici]|uniref:Uncharacterized protein n=1 Tax=Fuerstiella marisgermanici TaxID=1891926 RepID=A0A1P8W9X9_9PLAN|nr:hypothetical protein [Fuerstiella marisgermanici]APZ90851.1 hypothetical protein Fuma_00435 [Fuerstiella marisgermanici]
MKRIFLTLALIATAFLITAVVLGLNIGGLYFPDSDELNPETQSQISTHMLVGVGALVFAFLVHAISLTYFMGTGRWIEETSNAYSLDASFHKQNQKIKYGTLPGSTLCMLLLVATAALGAVADPATPASLDGTLGMTSAQIHFFTAIGTCIINLIVNFSQFVAISKNANVVEAVLAEVHRIRTERGLPV